MLIIARSLYTTVPHYSVGARAFNLREFTNCATFLHSSNSFTYYNFQIMFIESFRSETHTHTHTQSLTYTEQKEAHTHSHNICNHKYTIGLIGVVWCGFGVLVDIMVNDIPANLIGNCYKIQIIAFGAHAYLELQRKRAKVVIWTGARVATTLTVARLECAIQFRLADWSTTDQQK